MLTTEEIQRYDRHIIMPEIGREGQKKLKESAVFIVGAGGLGSAVSVYLAASGIGKLTVIDNDEVDLSNLQRQVMYSHDDIGKSKATVTGEKLSKQNPFIEVGVINDRLTNENAAGYLAGHDIAVIATDNSAARYLVNDTCVKLGIPFVHGSVSGFEGQIAVFNHNNGPTYRDLFPEPPEQDFQQPADKGVLAALPGVIGCMQAAEVVKIVAGVGEPLSGRLMMIDLMNMKTTEMIISK
jgi:adenylyltransferase/sulfurtransferase